VFLLEIKKIEYFLFSFLIWGSLFPYPFWGKAYVLVFIYLFICALSFIEMLFSAKVSVESLLSSALISSLVLMFHLLNEASIIWAVFVAGVFFALLLYPAESICEIYRIFRNLYAVTLIPGIIVWLLFIVGIDVDTMAIGIVADDIVPTQSKVDLGVSYILFPGSVMLDYMASWPVFRFQGWFDEPGVVGTVSALILAVEKFDVTKKSNKIIAFAGLISLSLAFYMLAALYMVLNIKRSWRVLLALITIVLFASIFPSPISQALDSKIFSRIQVSDDLSIQGDNRMSSSDMISWERWKSSSTNGILFGINTPIEGSSGWRVVLIKAGLLGMLLIVCIFVLSIIRRSTSLSFYQLTFGVIFIASFLQRPAVVLPFYLLMVIFLFGSRRSDQLCRSERDEANLRRELLRLMFINLF